MMGKKVSLIHTKSYDIKADHNYHDLTSILYFTRYLYIIICCLCLTIAMNVLALW